MKRRGLLIGMMVMLFCNSLWAGDYQFITDSVNQGILQVTYKSSAGKRAKVMVEKGQEKYTYDINTEGEKESFPLQLGNGTYKISLLENTTGNAYQLLGSTQVTMQLADEKTVFLSSVQNINWSVSSESIRYATELTKNANSLEEKAKLLYQEVVYHYLYDYYKLASLPTTYIPSIDTTYRDKEGICYDFASLFAAMLRSQGIPAKLIKGYTPNATGYHAWNEVYDSEKKEWLVIDTTYDLQVVSKKKVAVMVKPSSDYEQVYEY